VLERALKSKKVDTSGRGGTDGNLSRGNEKSLTPEGKRVPSEKDTPLGGGGTNNGRKVGGYFFLNMPPRSNSDQCPEETGPSDKGGVGVSALGTTAQGGREVLSSNCARKGNFIRKKGCNHRDLEGDPSPRTNTWGVGVLAIDNKNGGNEAEKRSDETPKESGWAGVVTHPGKRVRKACRHPCDEVDDKKRKERTRGENHLEPMEQDLLGSEGLDQVKRSPLPPTGRGPSKSTKRGGVLGVFPHPEFQG